MVKELRRKTKKIILCKKYRLLRNAQRLNRTHLSEFFSDEREGVQPLGNRIKWEFLKAQTETVCAFMLLNLLLNSHSLNIPKGLHPNEDNHHIQGMDELLHPHRPLRR